LGVKKLKLVRRGPGIISGTRFELTSQWPRVQHPKIVMKEADYTFSNDQMQMEV